MRFPRLKPKAPTSAESDSPTRVNQHDLQLKALCEGRDTRWYAGHLLKLTAICWILLITSMSNGFDGSMMNSLQTLSTWRNFFNDPQGGTLGLFNAIQNIGGLAGLPFAPFLNDRLGRRKTLFLGCVFMIIATVLQTASQNFGMFIASRFFIGFGNAWASIAAPILLTELAFPTHRAPLTSLYNSLWYLGSIVAAWTTFGTFVIPNTWAWRIPSAVQGAIPLVQICVIFFIPESPRWYLDHNREEEAVGVIAKWHCEGNTEDPLVKFEIHEIKTALRLEKLAEKGSSWKSLFTNRSNLRRFRVIIALAFFSQWSGNGIVSYYLNIVLRGIGITSEYEQNLLNGVLQIYNLCTAVIGALTVEKAGRRVLFLTSTAGMCMSYMVWTILSASYTNSATEFNDLGDPLNGTPSLGRGVLAVIFIYYGFYNIAMSPLIVSYTVEILPFRIRSKGLMVFQICVSASLVFNQYVNPIALGALGWRYYIVYTVWLAFEFTYLFFTVVETKGPNGSPLPLEEIAKLFDGDEAEPDLLESVAAQEEAARIAGMDGTEKKSDNGEVRQVERVEEGGYGRGNEIRPA